MGQPDGPVTLAEGTALLQAFTTAADARETAVRQLVQALGDLVRAGIVETLEGLPVDVMLAVRQRFTSAEIAMLCDAADALTVMPATVRWWEQGMLSWSLVRDIVAAVRPLGRDGRAAVDARLAASTDRLNDMTPAQITWAVHDAVDAVRGHAQTRRQETAAKEGSFLAVQMDLHGGGRLYGQLGPVDTAIITQGLDHRAALDQAQQDPPHQAGSRRARRRSRAKARAAALASLCRDSLGQQPRTGDRPAGGHPRLRPARPLIIIHVPLDRITTTAAGLLEIAVPGGMPRLSAALVESLAGDADVRAVVMDGARPLCVTSKVHAAAVPDDVRVAVQARDLGARDPAGTTPIPLSHIHHLDPGIHDVDRMVVASPRGHLRIIHRHGWRGHIDLDDGTVTWTSRHRHPITTRPWGTRLAEVDPPATAHDRPRIRRRPPPPEPPPPG